MILKPSTTRERNAARTIIALERLVADSTAAPKMRRAATLRLSRLRAATKPAAPVPRPAPDQESLLRGKLLARDAFLALAAQRRALIKRTNRTPAEDLILDTLLAEMPGTVPDGTADAAAWCDFVGAVSRTLAAIKSLPTR